MSGSSQGFFQTGPGKIVAATVTLLCVAGASYVIYGAWRGNSAVAQANDRIYIDSETGQSFHVNLDSLVGQSIPIKSPYTGRNTGYPAELCYWTADGNIKSDPTPVLLNVLVGKPGPTFCPDCGRLVVGHNPRPTPGARPPPTRAEWEKWHQP